MADITSEQIRRLAEYYNELRRKNREENAQIPQAGEIEIKCISCSKVLEPHQDFGNLEYTADSANYHYAAVHKVTAGYGSRYDMVELLIGVCDDCIDKAIEDKRINWSFNLLDLP